VVKNIIYRADDKGDETAEVFLTTYVWAPTVNCGTRIQNISSTAADRVIILSAHICLITSHCHSSLPCAMVHPHVAVHCVAINNMFLVTVFKEGAGNFSMLQFILSRHITSNQHMHSTSKFCQ
jgi:hypothetical protein